MFQVLRNPPPSSFSKFGILQSQCCYVRIVVISKVGQYLAWKLGDGSVSQVAAVQAQEPNFVNRQHLY